MEMVSGAVVAVKRRGKFLLLKRADDTWEFPTGEFEKEVNAHLDDTARRELAERTGLTVKKMEYIRSFVRTDGKRILIGYAYIVTEFEGEVKLSPVHKDYEWLKREEILKMKNVSIETLTVLNQFKDF